MAPDYPIAHVGPASPDPDSAEAIARKLFAELIADSRLDVSKLCSRYPPEQRSAIERCLAKLLAATLPSADPRTRRVGDLILVRELGRGGMGVVYLARDEKLDREVAVKLLPVTAATPARIERFRREARAAARMHHRSIVAVHAVGEHEGTPYIVMEYIAGKSLDRVLEDLRQGKPVALGNRVVPVDDCGQLLATEVARLVAGIADGLEHAHQGGILHRDIKPQNILIDEQLEPHIADFGLAKDLTIESITNSGDLAGTYYYMSPEQLLAKRVAVDHRTDVFSLGVLMYEALTLVRPFDGTTSHEVIRKISFEEARPPHHLNRRVPRDLETICAKAMEKNPADRYASAQAMAADLQRFLCGEAILAQPSSVLHRGARWLKKRRALVAVIVVILAAAGAGALVQQRMSGVAPPVGPTLSVTASRSDAPVVLRTIDPVTLVPGPRRALGRGSLVKVPIDPGLHRVIVGDAASGFAEVTLPIMAVAHDYAINVPLRPTADVISGMKHIAAGPFVFGSREQSAPFAERQASVDAFFIDETEVANRQYRRYLEDVRPGRTVRTPLLWDSGYDPAWDDLPVVGISLEEAQDYALWAGKRLPTVLEWQRAGRGTNGARYPWGDGIAPESPCATWRLVKPGRVRDVAGRADYVELALAVRSCPELATPDGIFHLFGNVQEWTESRAATDVGGVASLEYGTVVIAGCHWLTAPEAASLGGSQTVFSDYRGYDVGFRCAKSVNP